MMQNARRKLLWRPRVAMVTTSTTGSRVMEKPLKRRSETSTNATELGISWFGAKIKTRTLLNPIGHDSPNSCLWTTEGRNRIFRSTNLGPSLKMLASSLHPHTCCTFALARRNIFPIGVLALPKGESMKENPWRIRPTVKDATGAPRNARAIVVLIGWWGAKPQHLDKYADLYHEILPSAAIISGTASAGSILLKNDSQLSHFAKEGLEAIASTLAEYENLHLPVLVHVFSNGGGFVWHHMLKLLEEKEEAAMLQFHNCYDHATHTRPNLSLASVDTEETPLHANTALSLMRKNIRGQIYDSAPAYPKFDSGVAALEGSGMVGNRLLLAIVKCFFTLFFMVESIWDRIHNRPNRIMDYWKDLMECDWDIPQGFIYSTVDRMVDSNHLEDFIQARRDIMTSKEISTAISVLKFEDSPHVLHFRHHPEEYKKFVEQFIHTHLLRISRRDQT